MKELCRGADVIAPNLTEAAFLLDAPYVDGPLERPAVEAMLRDLCALGPRWAVLTGVRVEGLLGAACYDSSTGAAHFWLKEEIPGSYHGTGDLFSSTLLGGLLNGMDLSEACRTAVDFTHKVIETNSMRCICRSWRGLWRTFGRAPFEGLEARDSLKDSRAFRHGPLPFCVSFYLERMLLCIPC